MPSPHWREFGSPAELAEGLAATVAEALRSAVAAKGKAVIAVSGGSTPAWFLEALSGQELTWEKVVVTLVDERFVEPTSERSNERLVRETLLQANAAAATFVPLFTPHSSLDEAARQAAARQQAIGPLDIVVLGMGLDGHTASFFPDSTGIDVLLDREIKHAPVLPVKAPSAVEPRLTQSLGRLAAAPRLFLHIEGAEKRAVLETAIAAPASEPHAPVRRLLDAALHCVIFWAAGI